MAATIRIRIVAAVDASLANVFVPLTTASKRAGAAIGAGLAAGAEAGAAPYRSLPAKVSAPLAQAARSGKQFQDSMGAVADGAREKFKQLATEVGRTPAQVRAVTSAVQAELAKIERLKAQNALGLGKDVFGDKRMSYSGTGISMGGFGRVGMRLGMGALHGGMRLGADMLQGMGINTDLGSMFAQNQNLETTATNVSNFGYIPGSARNGQRISSKELVTEAHTVAQETGNQAGDVLEGLEKFVGLTGDLDTGRKSMKDLAILSKATGSNLAEMVEAAGNVSNVLGDIPDKGKAVYDVMRAVAGEGKTGAVLIKDLATQMAKVAAGAQMFTGDRGKNIAILGALAQEARGRGGAASASQAATSVSSFVNTFSKAARLQNFKGFGVEVQGAGGLRDPREIIIDTFNAAMKGGARITPEGKRRELAGGEKNFSQNIGFMFADVRARSAVRGFESVYRETYSATKGSEKEKEAEATKAVRAEFERLTSSAMSQELVMEDFRIAMQTSKSKAEVFNDQMSALAGKVRDDLMPPLIRLAPAALAAATKLAEIAAVMFGKPGADEYEASTKLYNKLQPFAKLTHVDGRAPEKWPMHFDPTKGALEFTSSPFFNPKTGKMEEHGTTNRTGQWVPDVEQMPEGGQAVVAKVKDEAAEVLARKQAAKAEAEAKFLEYMSPKNMRDGMSGKKSYGEAQELLGDPDKLRAFKEANPPVGGGLAQDVIEARGAVDRAQGDFEHAQAIADRIAEGIANKTIQVLIMNPEDIRPGKPGTSGTVGNGRPGQVSPSGEEPNSSPRAD